MVKTSFLKNIRTRFLAEDVVDSTGAVLFKKGHLLSKAEYLWLQVAIGEDAEQLLMMCAMSSI